ncbi:MAG: methylated-DNA--[protein]-cysteine S-methyltransferase [Desulfovibrio sp.]|uniref:methylated-DNA--[protein]-cysteine S-methyltransferase n=1 Tax=Desulfovibrio sp. 7SRBS1 TaxID=3378064 RepID=UPI003B3D1923
MVGELVCEVIVGRPLQLTLWWDRGLLDHIDLAWAGNGEGADAPAFSKWGRVVEEALHKYVRGEAVQWPDLPYRWERTTEFRTRVLKELQNVPAGETLSYGELAKRVGSPRASRAVGGCMATNRWPLLIPCHRVLASGGKLGGYGPGLDMKQWLLELEGAL